CWTTFASRLHVSFFRSTQSPWMTLLPHSATQECVLSCAPFSGGRERRRAAGVEPKPFVRLQASPHSSSAGPSNPSRSRRCNSLVAVRRRRAVYSGSRLTEHHKSDQPCRSIDTLATVRS